MITVILRDEGKPRESVIPETLARGVVRLVDLEAHARAARCSISRGVARRGAARPKLREPEIYYRRIMDAISPGGIGGGNFPEWVTWRASETETRKRARTPVKESRARDGAGS